MAKRVIAVDLDGTLAHYDGWKGIDHIGHVIPEVANAISDAQASGAEVWIFTARVSDPDDHNLASDAIAKWLVENKINVSGISAVKHKFFTEFWDDRAIQVIKNKGIFVMDPGSISDAPAAPVFLPDSGSESNNPLDVQEGGDHYKKYPIQPIVFCHANKIPSLESSIIKYVVRHKDKNGLEDLNKAKHTIDILIKLDYNI